MLKQVLQILPREAAQALDGLNAAQVEEIRLRCGQVPSILRRGVEQPLPHCERTPQQELQRTLLAASAQSQYAVQEQLREGFLSVPGGVRIGVCGSAVVQDGRVTGIRAAPFASRPLLPSHSSAARFSQNPTARPAMASW